MMAAAKRRLPYVISILIGVALLLESRDLQAWGIFGAGPGLFPRAVLVLLVFASAVLAIFPTLGEEHVEAAMDSQGDRSEAGPARTFWLYVAALPFLAFATVYLGFIGMSVSLALMLTWVAEGRRLGAALTFGLVFGLVGLVVFGLLLEVSIAETVIDRQILRSLR